MIVCEALKKRPPLRAPAQRASCDVYGVTCFKNCMFLASPVLHTVSEALGCHILVLLGELYRFHPKCSGGPVSSSAARPGVDMFTREMRVQKKPRNVLRKAKSKMSYKRPGREQHLEPLLHIMQGLVLFSFFSFNP